MLLMRPLDLAVARIFGLLVDGDRVDVGRGGRAGISHAALEGPLLQPREQIGRPGRPLSGDDAIQRVEPLGRLLRIVVVGHQREQPAGQRAVGGRFSRGIGSFMGFALRAELFRSGRTMNGVNSVLRGSENREYDIVYPILGSPSQWSNPSGIARFSPREDAGWPNRSRLPSGGFSACAINILPRSRPAGGTYLPAESAARGAIARAEVGW